MATERESQIADDDPFGMMALIQAHMARRENEARRERYDVDSVASTDDGDQIPEPTTPPLPNRLLGASCTGGQEIPIDVLRDILDKGDTDAVRRWFDAAPARDINETFTLTASFASQHLLWITDERVAVSGHTLLSIVTNSSVYLEGHVELVRWLLARGADPNTRTENGWSPLTFACVSTRGHYHRQGTLPNVWEVILLLIGAGANVNTVAPSELTPLGACLDRFEGRVSEENRLRGLEVVVRALLRAGALLHQCHAGYQWGTARWLLEQAGYETVHNPSGAWPRCKVLVEGVREAESYKAFFARRRRDVLTLRALALKGRAKTSDAVLGFVFGLPDGVAWNVLSFWRCHYPVTLPNGEGGRITVLVDC